MQSRCFESGWVVVVQFCSGEQHSGASAAAHQGRWREQRVGFWCRVCCRLFDHQRLTPHDDRASLATGGYAECFSCCLGIPAGGHLSSTWKVIKKCRKQQPIGPCHAQGPIWQQAAAVQGSGCSCCSQHSALPHIHNNNMTILADGSQLQAVGREAAGRTHLLMDSQPPQRLQLPRPPSPHSQGTIAACAGQQSAAFGLLPQREDEALPPCLWHCF
mmetsp:Transcript_16896/g.50445  ORF Transcript_16896/g.50445 Transcript_16896/m.50445 type:complete len:216 (+) Transcript_16896:953-1600(+)